MDESFTTYPEKFLEDNPQHLTKKSGLQDTPGIKSDPLDIQWMNYKIKLVSFFYYSDISNCIAFFQLDMDLVDLNISLTVSYNTWTSEIKKINSVHSESYWIKNALILFKIVF